VLFAPDDDTGVDAVPDEATRVTADAAAPAAPGDLVAGRYRIDGEARPDLWGVRIQAFDSVDRRPVMLHRIERAAFRTRDELEVFRGIQQSLAGRDEPVLLLPERLVESGGDIFLVFDGVPDGSLRDASAAAPFRGPGIRQLRKLLGFAAEYLRTLRAGGPHLLLRPSVLLVGRKELRAFQVGVAAGLPEALVARRAAHDDEAAFFGAPEVLQTGRGSARADLYSLGRIIAYSLSGRERAPQLKGFSLHRDLTDLLVRLTAADPVQRPSNPADVADAIEALARCDELARPAAAPAPAREATAQVAADEIESLDDNADGETLGEIDADDVVPAEGTAVVDADEVEPVEDEPAQNLGAAALPPVEHDDSWGVPPPAAARPAAARAAAVRAAAPKAETTDGKIDPRLLRAAVKADVERGIEPAERARKLLARTGSSIPGSMSSVAVKPAERIPVESDGAIDPRLLRAAVSSDAEKGVEVRGRALELLHKQARKGDRKSQEFLIKSLGGEPKMPAAALPVMPGRPSVPAPAPVMPGRPSVPAALPVMPGRPSVPAALPVMPGRPSVPAPAPVPAARAAAPVAAPAPRPSVPAQVPRGRVEVDEDPVTFRPAEPMRIIQSGALLQGSVAGRPLVIKKPRAPDRDPDAPSTASWAPPRVIARPIGQTAAEAEALFDDSYRKVKLDDLARQAAAAAPGTQAGRAVPGSSLFSPERAGDLIWWSLAIAGVLVALALILVLR
jgi:hypothetical protein